MNPHPDRRPWRAGTCRTWLLAGLAAVGGLLALLILWGWRQGGWEILQLSSAFC